MKKYLQFTIKPFNSCNFQIWPLNPGDTSLFYATIGVLGMADGVWNTQISGH